MSHILKRLGMMLVVVWLAATINFILPHLTERNPVEERLAQALSDSGGSTAGLDELVRQYRQKFGVDQPLWKQYLAMLYDSARLDLGVSISYYPDRVAQHVLQALPWSIGLLGTATLISFALGTTLGALTVWLRAGHWLNRVVPLLMILSAIPFYLVGLILIYVFALILQWFPSGGGVGVGFQPGLNWATIAEIMYHAFLPAMSIVLAATGIWALSMRGMMVTVQGDDYMNFGRARGLKDWRLFWRYAVRNAVTPQITTLVLSLSNIVTGAVLVERVFSYPGVGTLLYNSVLLVDYFMIFGCVLVLIITLGISLMLLDLLYPLLDPRIRTGANTNA